MSVLRRFCSAGEGLATIEYVIGAAVVLGTLVIGVTAYLPALMLLVVIPLLLGLLDGLFV